MILYIGDTNNIWSRICEKHCSGGMGGSALRRTLAVTKGYSILRTRRKSGNSYKTSIDCGDPKSVKASISLYLKSGTWTLVKCHTPIEAEDFQWYAIDKLRPRLNKAKRKWDLNNESRYQYLLEELQNSRQYHYKAIKKNEWTLPGVYVFSNESEP